MTIARKHLLWNDLVGDRLHLEVLDITHSFSSSNISRTDGQTTNETGSLYEAEVTKRPVPRNDRGNRYHGNRYYRDDEEYRYMKFGEEIGTRCLRKLKERSDELRELVRQLRELSTQAESPIDIRIEDHGKAISTFTIVTIIFLPLSFVCSYLGMKTVDIRNTTSTQLLFSYTALPLASVLVLKLDPGIPSAPVAADVSLCPVLYRFSHFSGGGRQDVSETEPKPSSLRTD
jgi:hypothetical protein